jgi:valyl-tRNA synthetase
VPELAEREETRAVTLHCYELYLKLLHPYLPFVTEEIWRALGRPELLIRSAWPVASLAEAWPEDASGVETAVRLLTAVRRIRTEAKVEPKAQVEARVEVAADAADAAVLHACEPVIRRLAGVGQLAWGAVEGADGATVAVDPAFRVAVDLGQANRDAERERLSKQLAETQKRLEAAEKRLANPDFLSRAKPEVVAGARSEADKLRATVAAVEERLAAVG